jgi:hypothetical protein
MTERPRWIHEFEDLAAVAGDLIARRTRDYPGHIERGTISAEEAAAGIRIMAAITYDWRRHIDLIRLRLAEPTNPEPKPATRAERIATLETATARAAALAAKTPDNQVAADYAEMVATLLWWERETLGIRFITDTNLAMRAQVLDAPAEAA